MKDLIIRTVSCILCICILAGCQSQHKSSQKTGTVYLDLVAIAKALGRDELMQQQIKSVQIQLNTQLLEITSDLKKNLETERTRLGDDPEETELQDLEDRTVAANQRLRQTQMLAQQKLASFQQQLLTGFRNEVQTTAAPIAGQRGATGIAIIGADTLWFDPAADITDEVIGAMRVMKQAASVEKPTAVSDSEIEKLNQVMESIENSKTDSTAITPETSTQ